MLEIEIHEARRRWLKYRPFSEILKDSNQLGKQKRKGKRNQLKAKFDKIILLYIFTLLRSYSSVEIQTRDKHD